MKPLIVAATSTDAAKRGDLANNLAASLCVYCAFAIGYGVPFWFLTPTSRSLVHDACFLKPPKRITDDDISFPAPAEPQRPPQPLAPVVRDSAAAARRIADPPPTRNGARGVLRQRDAAP